MPRRFGGPDWAAPLLTVLVVLAVVIQPVAAVYAPLSPDAGSQTAALDTASITTSSAGTLVVNKSNGSNFDTIQNAIDNASDGDSVVVHRAIYRENLTVDKNITVFAENGTELNGTTSSGAAAITIPQHSPAQPLIDGFEILGYSTGVKAVETDAAWTLQNLTIKGNSLGVNAFAAGGDWRLRWSTVTNNDDGIFANGTEGAWTIANTSITDHRVGLFAGTTTGAWTVTDSVFERNHHMAISAALASPAGDATHNYWGAADGPSGDFDGSGDAVVGNVTVHPHYEDEGLTSLSSAITIQQTHGFTTHFDRNTSKQVGVTADANLTLDNGSNYVFRLVDADTGDRLELILNGSIVVLPETDLGLFVHRGDGEPESEPHIWPAGQASPLPADVVNGSLSAYSGLTNFSVELVNASTGAEIDRTAAHGAVLNYTGTLTQNSSTGIIRLSIDRDVVPKSAAATFVLRNDSGFHRTFGMTYDASTDAYLVDIDTANLSAGNYSWKTSWAKGGSRILQVGDFSNQKQNVTISSEDNQDSVAGGGGGGAAAVAWPTLSATTARTGHLAADGPRRNISKRWNFSTGDWVASSPAVVNGTVYIGSYDNTVYAIDASTGTQRWNYTTDDIVISSPAVANGSVFIGSFDGRVYALDAATGSERWNFSTGSGIFGSPAVANGSVYIGSLDNTVYALEATGGTPRWNFTTKGDIFSSPAVANGTVYVGSNDTNVYAFDTTTGAVEWNFSTGDWVVSPPAVSNGSVYVGSGNSKTYALDANSGAVEWTFDTDGPVLSSPAVVGNTVYAASYDHRVYALDASTGAERWNYTTGDVVFSSPAVVDRTVYIGSFDNTTYALNATTGEIRWQFETNGWIASSPAVVNGTLYLGSFDSGVYALSEGVGSTNDTTDGSTEPVLAISNLTILPGERGQVRVKLSEAPDGLSGFDINLSVENGTVANITAASIPSTFGLTETTLHDRGQKVNIHAADTDNNTVPGDTNITLATIELEGVEPGQTNATIAAIISLDDDFGSVISTTQRAGRIDVNSAPKVNVTGTVRRPDGTAASVDLVAFDSGLGLSLAETDSAGNFTFAATANTTYSVGFFQQDEGNNSVGPVGDGVADVAAFDVVNSSTGLDLGVLAVTVGHTLDVRVVNESGYPVRNATVDVSVPNGFDRVGIGNIQTNSAGYLLLENATGTGVDVNGSVRIVVRPPDTRAFVNTTYTKFVNVTSAQEVTITVEERLTTVSGRVFENDSDPAANDSVVVFVEQPSEKAGFFNYTRTDETGHFVMEILQDEPQDLQYYQTHPNEFTGISGPTPTNATPFPRDGSPDVFALSRVNTSIPIDLGNRTLPVAHQVNVTVTDENGTPVENATVSFTHFAPGGPAWFNGSNAEAGVFWINGTNTDGRFEEPDSDGPGLELTGNVTISVEPPADSSRFVDREYYRNLTITGERTVSFTLEERTGPTVFTNSTDVDQSETGRIRLALSKAPEGLSGYNITVSLPNGTIANFTGARYPASFDLPTTVINDGGSRIHVKAADLDNNTIPGDINITLAYIDIQGLTSGSTDLRISINALDDDSGRTMVGSTAVDPGSVRVAPQFVVNKSNPAAYQSIQNAVDNASSGATVEVTAGTYNETLVINKSITLIGDPGDSTPGPGADAPVLNGGNRVGSAITIAEGVSNVTITGVVIRNYTRGAREAGNGIVAINNGTAHVLVRDSLLQHLSGGGVVTGLPSASPSGHHTNWTVRDTRVATTQYGIVLTDTSHAIIANNRIRGSDTLPGTSAGSYVGIGVIATARTSHVVTNTRVKHNLVGGEFSGFGSSGIAVWADGDVSDQFRNATIRAVTIVENRVDIATANRGINIVPWGNASKGSWGVTEDLLIARNDVSTVGGYQAIGLAGEPGELAVLRNATVRSNRVHNSTSVGIGLFAVDRYRVRDLTIEANLVENVSNSGIWLRYGHQATGRHIAVQSNAIFRSDDGIEIQTFDTASTSNTTVRHNLIRRISRGGQSDSEGIEIRTVGNSTQWGPHIQANQIWNTSGEAIIINTLGNATQRDLLIEANNISDTDEEGIQVDPFENGAIHNATVRSNYVARTNFSGIFAAAFHEATLNETTISGNFVADSNERGVFVAAYNDATHSEAVIRNNEIAGTKFRAGVDVSGWGNASLRTVQVEANLIRDSSAKGVWLTANNNATVRQIAIRGNAVEFVGNSGIQAGAWQNSSLQNVSVVGNGVANSSSAGLKIGGDGVSATFTGATFSKNRVSDSATGVAIQPSGLVTVRNVSISKMAIEHIGGNGIIVRPFDQARIEGVRIRSTRIHDVGTGVRVRNVAAPWHLENVTISEAGAGVHADDTTSNWSIRNTSITYAGTGVSATNTSGRWTIEAVRVAHTWSSGVDATNSSGAWVIEDTSFNDTENGVRAGWSEGDWVIRNTTIANSSIEGVFGDFAAGDWAIVNSVIRDGATEGVDVDPTTGNWTIAGSVITNNAGDGVNAVESVGAWEIRRTRITNNTGHAVDADRSNGAWTIHHATFSGNAGAGVSTEQGSGLGNATRNYWGAADGPSGAFNGSGEAAGCRVEVSPFFTDASLTTLSTDIGKETVLTVDTSDPAAYHSISRAVEDACSGATINVTSGTYNETLYIDKPLTLKGQPGDESVGPAAAAPVLDGNYARHTAIFLADGVSNVTITGLEIREYTGKGIWADPDPTANVTISHNYIHNITGATWPVGIVSRFAQDGKHTEWRIHHNVITRIGFTGIHLANARDSIVADNVITGGRNVTNPFSANTTSGLTIQSRAVTHDSVVSNITVRNNSLPGPFDFTAIHAFPVNLSNGTSAHLVNLTVSGNRITGVQSGVSPNWNGSGISITRWRSNTSVRGIHIDRNTIRGVPRAIRLRNASRGRIADNRLSNGGLGIDLLGVARFRIVDNAIWNNSDVALILQSTHERAADDIAVRNNVITNNSGGGILVTNGSQVETIPVHENRITGNTPFGLRNADPDRLNATLNYWGAADGPSGDFDGSGDAVIGNVTVRPFYRDPAFSTRSSDRVNVTGTLRHPAGSPATGFLVSAWRPDEPVPEGLIDVNQTSPTGRFRLTIPANRTYAINALQLNLTAAHLGDRDGTVDLFAVGRREDASTARLGNVTLPAGHVLNVTVVDESGAPVANASVDIVHRNHAADARAPYPDHPTNADGMLVAKAFAPRGFDRSDMPGIELTGDISLAIRPPTDPVFRNRTYRRNVTVTNDTGLAVRFIERPEVTVEPARPAVNGEAEIDITLDKAPTGLSGYNITLAFENGTVANFTGATYPSTFGLSETRVVNENDTIVLKAGDLDNETVPGDTDITLATVSLRGTAAGRTNVSVLINALDDDTGAIVDALPRRGEIQVLACSPLAPDLPAPTDPDGDGDFEDTNGNGRFDFDDIVTLFEELESAQPGCEDFNHNGRMDFDDIVTLFEEI